MGGIAGCYQQADGHKLVDLMADRIAHRGPDGAGQWDYEDDRVAIQLGQRRLAVIDPGAVTGPLTKSGLTLVYDGELYNAGVLRAELTVRGVRFTTGSDSEVILEAWRAWGPDALGRFRGMFAFALFDDRSGDLILARDPFGIKPLYFLPRGPGLLFASELKAIVSAVGPELRMEPGALVASMLYHWLPEQHCAIQNVEKLPGGSWARLRPDGNCSIQYYFRAANLAVWSAAGPPADLGAVIEASVAAHLVSDVPVSTFLSGGLDSSIIAALAQRDIPALDAYTIAPDRGDRHSPAVSDDAAHARTLATRHGITLHEIDMAPDIVDMLPRIVDVLDEPIADPAAIGTVLMCEAARARGVKVMLSGTGADELFGGYRRHLDCVLADRYGRLPAASRSMARAAVDQIPAGLTGRGLRWARRFLTFAELPEEPRYRRSYTLYDPAGLTSLISPDLAGYVGDLVASHRHIYRDNTLTDEINRMCLADTRLFLPGLSLASMERAGLAASVEVRFPFVDPEVARAAFALPGRAKIHRQQGKIALRQAAEAWLPAEIAHRPRASLRVPLRAWVRNDLLEVIQDVLVHGELAGSGMIRRDALLGLIRDEQAGREDRSRQLWQLLTLELWHRHARSLGVAGLSAPPEETMNQAVTSSVRIGRIGWYARRVTRMSPAEIGWRAYDQALHTAWSRRQVRHEELAAISSRAAGHRQFLAVLPPDTADGVTGDARATVLAAADLLMKGEWEVLGVTRTDLVTPDWFYDPVTGRRSSSDRYAFSINHRSEAQTGNVKQVWEISRLQHLTLLATAWFLTRDEVYADRVAEQLRSWWRENPFLSGIHWTNGIELGIRLISLAWIRRLLDDWPGAAGLFEDNGLALQQIRWHQQYLAAFRSRGSSANNHVIAEAAGQLVASCAFPWFPESERWRRGAARLLERELLRNTFPSGVDRELASDYQRFVAELGLLAAVEADVAGRPLSPAAWSRLAAMTDSAAALVDQRLRPPRQGDGDDGRALLLDPPVPDSWASLLSLGAALVGRREWWPAVAADATSTIVGRLAGATRVVPGRPPSRPSRFADAGTTLLRTDDLDAPEIWCRCDGGPHGYLSIAAHAHADALSVEVRHGGVDVLADPGTYCYHGEPAWRSYFRSTIAHNTVELDGQNQSGDGGPFLWLRHANGQEIGVADIGARARWSAEHDGYRSLDPAARHRRSVRLDRAARTIEIVDDIDAGPHDIRVAFHLGPEVEAELSGATAALDWAGAATPGAARLELPAQLQWSLHRGETDPILGWYSPGLGRRIPAYTLIGRGRCAPGAPVTTRLVFLDKG